MVDEKAAFGWPFSLWVRSRPSPKDTTPPASQPCPDPHPGPARMRTAHKTEFARHLRRTMTDAEREIWHHLRNRALMGHQFRRQYPVGPYTLDFARPARPPLVALAGGDRKQTVAGQECAGRVDSG